MPEDECLYPQATRDLAEQRTRLAPGPAAGFRAFGQSVFAGGAYAHSALALDTISRYESERAGHPADVAGVPRPTAERPPDA